MNEAFGEFLKLSERDRKDVFEAAAQRLEITQPSYIEKDFWVCLVLDLLYSGLPDDHPTLYFKGGTSLSKAFGLIRRFSEDIDIVVDRDALGFNAEHDPTNPSTNLSNNKRRALFDELKDACSSYISGGLLSTLSEKLGELDSDCRVIFDDDSPDSPDPTLLVEYPTLYPSDDVDYVLPQVKIEGGARSALDPRTTCSVRPYIHDELSDDWHFLVEGITTITSERTFWEKVLILHGTYCGFRDEGRLPDDRNRISRHYYDVAMIGATEVGLSAMSCRDLGDAVREHNLIVFRTAWKRFEEAVPGTTRVVPQPGLRAVIEDDYRRMQDMIMGDAPEMSWIMEKLEHVEETINRA